MIYASVQTDGSVLLRSRVTDDAGVVVGDAARVVTESDPLYEEWLAHALDPASTPQPPASASGVGSD